MGKTINIEKAANFGKRRGDNGFGKDKPARVLIADDDPGHLKSLCLLIESIGLQTAKATNGEEAIAMLDASPFDILLLDLQMPKLDGHQVLERVRGNAPSPGVIIVSGEPSWDKAQNTLRMGADDFIRKPYAPDEVLTSVKNLLRKRRLERENQAFQNQLTRSEQLHRFIVNHSPDFIFILDTEGRFTFLNNTVTNLLGYDYNLLIRQHYSRVFIDKKGSVERFLANPHHTNDGIECIEIFAKQRDPNAHPLVMEVTLMGLKDAAGDKGVVHGVARNITERKKAEEMINYQAYHDLLTGLPNRALFKDRLGVAIRHAQRDNNRVAVMFLDLDRFKMVNDSLGHSYGDRLLQNVAERISGCIREGDTVARIGGDEFTLVLPAIHEHSDAEAIAKKILTALRGVFNIDNHDIFVRASIGIALYRDHGSDIETLLKNADMAMYEIKASGRDGFGFYTEKLEAKYARRLSMENGIRNALEQLQFEVHYQPQVNMNDNSFCGMEALIRWRHPEKGYIPPIDFISYAEESGLIMPIGMWVFETVLRDLRYWDSLGIHIGKASINVSSIQLEHPNFISLVEELLEKYQVAGDRLVVEITESILLDDMNLVVQRLKDLHDLDIHVSIDDFGTGYSSLSYLKSLPIHALKIDRSFIMDIKSETDHDSIVTAIIAMARSLELDVVAEGIEEDTQATYLASLGCPKAQGFLYSKPLTRKDLTKYLQSPANLEQTA